MIITDFLFEFREQYISSNRQTRIIKYLSKLKERKEILHWTVDSKGIKISLQVAMNSFDSSKEYIAEWRKAHDNLL